MFRRIGFREIVCVLALGGAFSDASAAAAATAACKIGMLGEIPVAIYQNRLITDGMINGQPVKVVILTGAQFSFLEESSAHRLNLPVVENSQVRMFGNKGRLSL